MPRINPTNEQLRAQIEAAAATHFPVAPIEQRIAESLLSEGRFKGNLSSEELGTILRSIVYNAFAQQRFAGVDVGLVHNVPTMKVNINNSQADVKFIVHIHKPIVAFIKFGYVLINDPVSISQKLRLKPGTLSVSEHTRRLDLKAKAALATINVSRMALQELSDLTAIIESTLPAQLKQHGVTGKLSNVELAFQDHCLDISVEGNFRPIRPVS